MCGGLGRNFTTYMLASLRLETWNLTIRAQKRLLTLENKVLRRILGPKRDLVTGRLRIRSNEEIRSLTGQPLIKGVVKMHRLRWAGHVFRAPAKRAIVTAMSGPR